MNRKKLSAYGQEFDDDDEEGVTVSKKPTQIHEEIATDEKGKRRFHGAFTGGFSAGYWNTVGSKQGWVPQVFSSSKDARGDQIKQRAEDFMDAEDLGEYGIGNRSIKQTSTFGDGGSQKRKLAWERDAASVSTITQMFEDVVKPVSNSIGVRMLRSMGWREGRGVGLANVKQKKNRGGMTEEAEFDREQAAKVAPSYELANEDALVKQLTPLSGDHGIGYQGLRQTTVLNESYGRTALALKSGNKNSKGIRGQAFGVGAFEEEDESVYSNYDLSQFDFSLDVAGTSGESDLKTQKVDTAFELQPKRLNPRKFYGPPRVPPNFRGSHKPIPMDISKLPLLMKEDVKQMTAVQRAKFLGEDRLNVLEIGVQDNNKPKERRSRWDIKANEVEQREGKRGGEADEERDRRLRNRVEFPNEPMRQARFKEFLHYIRRGLPYPQPTDLTVWEWEWEKKEFESKLTTEERGMLPEVQSRAQPLAKTAIAAPIHEMMASKFVKEAAGDLKVGTKDEDKLAAVKMEMFGDRTRQSFEWYPDALLAKRFNVPHPFPGCDMVGVPALQKTNWRQKDTLADIGFSTSVGLPNTANEIEMRERLLKTRARRAAEDANRRESDDEEYADKNEDLDEEEKKEEPKEEKAPKSFFDLIFGDGFEIDDDDSEDEKEQEKERQKELERRKEEEKKRMEEKEKKEEERRKEVHKELKKLEEKQRLGLKSRKENDDDDIQVIEEISKNVKSYGPTLPPMAATLSKDSVLHLLEKSIKEKDGSKKKKKKEEKERKHSKKSKKSKKSRKAKKKKRYSSSSDSSDDSGEWEEK
ncbi:hypothetical protein B9Z55_010053 [Caenorhabditis nigoni]|uniref:G-patch domain-containing protein n=1 Tax=Caenorhabditis nigoni TaxID=1611254 RepID=A0A2G5UE85_9PELO|nr:hypothetical protein B9Z55_010053 [Caenorhabditis nigoni]